MVMNEEQVKKAIQDLVRALKPGMTESYLADTPARVVKSYSKILEGYSRDLSEEMTVFPNEDNYQGIIYSGQIKFFSTCEHHLLPFYGTAHVAYVPNENIAGLSKLSRAVDIYARRLQQQERITTEVAQGLEDTLRPKGVAVMLEGVHLCNAARGVQQFTSNMKTIDFRGVFKDSSSLQAQFLEFTKQ